MAAARARVIAMFFFTGCTFAQVAQGELKPVTRKFSHHRTGGNLCSLFKTGTTLPRLAKRSNWGRNRKNTQVSRLFNEKWLFVTNSGILRVKNDSKDSIAYLYP